MDPKCVIAPSPLSDWTAVDEDTVELARKKQGTLYRKHILNRGELHHPLTGTKITIDDAFVTHLQTNFANNVCDIVQVPLANDQNEHVENPAANVGEVLGIEDDKKTGKIYALVDARKHADDFGKTILGASAFLHLNYKDSKTNKRVGPTLLHVAATNRPYVTGLDPYEPVVAASAEYLGEPALMQMSGGNDRESAMPRSLEEVLTELRTDHEIDVNALRTQLTDVEKAKADEAARAEAAIVTAKAAEDKLAATTTKLTQALAGSEEGTKLTGSGDVSSEDVVNAVAELAQRNVALSAAQEASVDRIAALEKRNVEAEIDGLIKEGRILPAKREVFLTMALTSREIFDQVVPDEPIVALNAERGVAPRADEHGKREFDVEAELARLTAPGGPAAEYVRS
jgi:hypothetical protein